MSSTLITGGTGMLGSSLSKYLKECEHNVVVHGYKSKSDISADLSEKQSAFDLLDFLDPSAVINLVCLSNVDQNESDQEMAYKLNVKPVENISEWIRARNKEIRFIQISTDHVYDSPGLNQEDKVICRNVYAATKYEADMIALDSGACILRTNFFGRSESNKRKTFSDWIEMNLIEEKPMKLFNDVYFSPLSIETLTIMIFHVIENFRSGIYNLGSHDGMSKSEFAYKFIAKMNYKDLLLTEVSVDEIGLKANRPKGMLMDVGKFEESFKVKLPDLDWEIQKHIEGVK
ncbi:MAG: hypothetical protein CMD06_03770 [Flavobacteriales bacterium]|nr:hypothetical protein [Flavobacteriales bacterium]